MSAPRQRHIPKHAAETPLSLFLWGGREKFERRKEVLETLSSNPVFSKGEIVYPSLARKDVWARTAMQSRELIRIYLTKKWPHRHFMEAIRMTDWMLPVQPQFRIFMSNLERQMTDEQKAIWIPKAERFEIFGSYCQTELGHGSNVRGIETTATFDEERDEFVINSPTVSSTKYWIGATGVWATHGIVVARLIIKERDYGNHLFLTQLRNLETQELMPGMEIYELGPKAFQGMLGTDNGALQFHKVRIPRNQMLMRNAQVLRDGTYIKPKNEKHSYGSMVTVRALMAEITAHDLVRAVVTAYHYTTFRKQFKKSQNSTNEETTVFDYASVRYRLLPLLAQATTLAIVGQEIKRAYDDYTTSMLSSGDTSQLEDLHLQTVGAKVYSTEITGKGVETCRIACGGHGYNALSGFGRMYAHAINAVTYEGDNYVIGQQVPRAILKHYKAGTYISLPSLSYLSILSSDTTTTTTPDLLTCSSWFSQETQRWALETRLVTMVHQHLSDASAGLDTSYTSHSLTMAHCDYVYWKGLQSAVSRLTSEPYYPHISSLATVFALSILFTPHHSSLAQALPLTPSQLSSLREAYDKAINDMAENHTQQIIDAWGLTEYELDSALARHDLDPYEALLEGAKKSEMSGEKMKHLWGMMIDTRGLWRRIESERTGVDAKAKL